MKCNENDFESKEIQISDNNIKSPIYLNGEKYLMNIYLMKDNINIIFKLEKEKIITYYYSSKYDLKDFNNMSKLFLEDINIQDIFLHLKELFLKATINLEKTDKENKIYIIFQISDTKKIKFPLYKKLISQKKINLILEEQIIDNKLKLNIIKNQIIRTDKSIYLKSDLKNKIKISISNINKTLNNIHSINNNLLNSNSISTKNSSIESNSISENNIYNNNITNNNKDNYQEEAKKEQKTQNDNLSNKKNNKDTDKNNKNENNANAFFCYENKQNYKTIEFLIIFNVVTILVVLYIFGSNFNIGLTQKFDSENENRNKLTYLALIDNSRNNNNFRDILQENLEIQKNKKEGTVTNSNLKEEEEFTENKKKKIQDKLHKYYDYL
jgi:hypothetical protein